MKLITRGVLMAAIVGAGCTQSGQPSAGLHTAGTYVSPDPSTYRMMSGSRIPQPTDRPFFEPLSATAPYNSASREGFSLIPTEPTVGAGTQSLYRQNESNTGAGPQGEPTLGGATGSTVPGATPSPHVKAPAKPKAAASPAPTPR